MCDYAAGFGVLKKCVAQYNMAKAKMEKSVGDAIVQAADEVKFTMKERRDCERPEEKCALCVCAVPFRVSTCLCSSLKGMRACATYVHSLDVLAIHDVAILQTLSAYSMRHGSMRRLFLPRLWRVTVRCSVS